MTDSSTPSAALRMPRVFSTPGVHPYDQLTWSRRDVEQKNWKTGETIFSQLGVEFPTSWTDNAVTVVTTKYFSGSLGTPARENSLRQLIDRVVRVYVKAAAANGYFADASTVEVFSDELTWLLVNQHFAFNSPVWFNVGTNRPQVVSACFILSVDDSIESILDWYKEEGRIFKAGSGAGINLSALRSSKELLANGGTASGPVSFMRGADASAGTIKSGGTVRRAAKMVILDVDHPDIEEFVATKVNEEGKIRVLRDAGYEMDLGGADMSSVQYQNANNSVRVSDEFMRAVEAGTEFGLTARTTGEVISSVNAPALFTSIAHAAWSCADPGIQYDSTIQAWHTTSVTGPITGSNPCSEFMSNDNTSCNLASLNLLKFRRPDGAFDTERFSAAVEVVITAMDISICFADFPTEKITANTRDFRQLGIGYANLGALLMASGLAYDSEAGRDLAAGITALLTGVAYRRSAELAAVVGPYAGFAANHVPHTAVMARHDAAARDLAARTGTAVAEAARLAWADALVLGATHGYRNAQASVAAPTGTISFLMDCDTTGIEPDMALVKFKKLVGGGSLQIVNTQVPAAMAALGYDSSTCAAVEEFVLAHGNVVGAPGLRPEHYDVFDCALGERAISPLGHVLMMAAAQPFLSGAISKTVNMPDTATVADIEDIYLTGWKLGLKCLAVYRDNCKVGQPLSDAKAKKAIAPAPAETGAPVEVVEKIVERIVYRPQRTRLEFQRTAKTTSFKIGELEGYLVAGEFPDGSLGELFIKVSNHGTTLSGILDGLSLSVSLGLQYGVPLEVFVEKYRGMRFEPAGMTNDPDARMTNSVLSYIFGRLAMDYLDVETRQSLGVYTTAERVALVDAAHAPAAAALAPAVSESPSTAPATAVRSEGLKLSVAKPLCFTCGTSQFMQPAGACFICTSCFSSSGCS